VQVRVPMPVAVSLHSLLTLTSVQSLLTSCHHLSGGGRLQAGAVGGCGGVGLLQRARHGAFLRIRGMASPALLRLERMQMRDDDPPPLWTYSVSYAAPGHLVFHH
jgi:hypothetical protein